MKVKNFEEFTIRPVANGLIVEPLHSYLSENAATPPSEVFVFDDMDVFNQWMYKQIFDDKETQS